MSGIKGTQYNGQGCVNFLILRLKLPTTSRVSTTILWIYGNFYVYSINRYWHHAKFAVRRQITIWALNKYGRMVRLKGKYLVIWYRIEDLLHLYKSYLLKLLETWSSIEVNMIWRNEADFL